VSRSRRPLEIVYLLTGCEARRSQLRGDARAYCDHADYRLLAIELARRRLLPLIGSRAVEAGDDAVPEWFRDAVASARTAARARGLALDAATRELAGALGKAGIRALPLKGPLLAEDVHGDIGLRETSDIDLLVSASEIDAAVGVLRERGYSQPTDARRGNGLPDLHFGLHHPTLPSVDVHWRVYWYESAFSDRLLANAVADPDGTLRAQPADLAASLLLFYARDGFHGVRLACDLAAWWDKHGSALPPRFLEEHAARYEGIAPALTAAAVAVERVTGVPAGDWLGEAAAPSRRVSAAARLADWTQDADRDQMAANISLVGGLLAPAGSAPEFARRELVLKGHGATASAAHAAKVVARYGIALWQVRGSRAWAGPPGAIP
jgi:putative nucleotidyltransferase-like protein